MLLLLKLLGNLPQITIERNTDRRVRVTRSYFNTLKPYHLVRARVSTAGKISGIPRRSRLSFPQGKQGCVGEFYRHFDRSTYTRLRGA